MNDWPPYSLGRVVLPAGDAGGAIAELPEAIRTHASTPFGSPYSLQGDWHLCLTQALVTKGDRASAREEQEAAHPLNPNGSSCEPPQMCLHFHRLGRCREFGSYRQSLPSGPAPLKLGVEADGLNLERIAAAIC